MLQLCETLVHVFVVNIPHESIEWDLTSDSTREDSRTQEAEQVGVKV